jgi:3-hydroxymyristoyl/3-hydroxydecanoyl-(acyl carrier protein) dehydratase
MEREAQLHAPLDHPCYAGHFPGHPIVPGVVLLDLVFAAIARGAPRSLGSVKFHRAVKPGDTFSLRYQLAGERLTFRCVDGERLLVEGTASFGP